MPSHRIIIAVLAATLILTIVTPPAATSAGPIGDALLGPTTPSNVLLTTWGNQAHLGTIVARIIGFIMGFLGIVSVILITYAGFLYFTAAGEDEKVKQSMKLLNQAVIGLVIILSTWAIAYFVINAIVQATRP